MSHIRLKAATAVVAGWVALAAPVLAQTATTPPVTPQPARHTGVDVQGFNVVLVLGDMQGGTNTDNVPPAARKALADMKDFLPYKGYRLLDTLWILGGRQTAGRLRGPDDQEYRFNLSFNGPAERMNLSFQLLDGEFGKAGVAAEVEARMQERTVEEMVVKRAKQEQELSDLRAKNQEKHPSVVHLKSELEQTQRQLADLEQKMRPEGKRVGGCCIISTSFMMEVGETVVVGTSRLRGGDKALIALLTAVPRGKAVKDE